MIEGAFGNSRSEDFVPNDATKGEGEEEGHSEVEGGADPEVGEQS